VVLAGWVVARTAGLSSAAIENHGAVPIPAHYAPSFSADTERAEVPPAIATDNAAIADVNAAVADVEVASVAASPAVTTTDTRAAADEPAPIVVAALPDPSQMLPPETAPAEVATASTPDPVSDEVKEAVSPIEVQDECLIVDICIDRYLWALYERTPKEDTNQVQEPRKVTVKRKGKMVTVVRSFTRLVDADFTWKDPKAAERVGMPMIDYVIGGMDRGFKLKLFHTLRAAEQAGLSPGITSAFRDDYRQSIASGLKAASNRSFHGGSLRGGYGHGLAADVVSVKGTTRDERWAASESLWKWIDANGRDFGIGRPYLNRDPPHVAPVDGNEYVSRRGTKPQIAASHMSKRKRVAVRDDHSVAKTPGKPNHVRAGSAARYTRQGAVADRPTLAALKRS
jgi:hypothetical protein